jgi:hypothetical protein
MDTSALRIDLDHPSVSAPRTRVAAAVTGIRRSIFLYGAIAILLFATILVLQHKAGAYQAEFGSHPDEAAHYVTGLMVREYLAHGLPGNPMDFAQQYYNHYPKVALGNWPPVFYAIQAAWTLPFSATRPSVLLLMAVLACATALIVVSAVRRELGWIAAAWAGLLFTAFGLTQQYASMVMTETPVALFSCLAMLAFGRYLDRPRARDSVLFGLLASIAIMTKGSGLALALMPPLAILFSGRFGVLKRIDLLYPVAIVLVLAGPWTWAFRDVARGGWEQPTISLEYTLRGLVYFPRAMLRSASPVVTVFALVGLVWSIRGVRRGTLSAQWAAAAAMIVSVIVFHAIVPASLDYRHLTQALPSWAMVAAAGVFAVHHMVRQQSPRLTFIVIAFAIAGVAHTASSFPAKHGSGFARVVDEVLNRPENAKARFMIASDAAGEGMFIAEAAMREPRPTHVIRRASKVLAAQQWDGSDYAAKVGNTAGVLAALKKDRVRFVVFDESNPSALQTPHTRLLKAAAEADGQGLKLVATYPITRGYPRQVRGQTFPNAIEIYEVR